MCSFRPAVFQPLCCCFLSEDTVFVLFLVINLLTHYDSHHTFHWDLLLKLSIFLCIHHTWTSLETKLIKPMNSNNCSQEEILPTKQQFCSETFRRRLSVNASVLLNCTLHVSIFLHVCVFVPQQAA